MKLRHILYILFFAVGIFRQETSLAYEPVFKEGILIEANNIAIDVGSYCVPNVCDWNNDGMKDLLVGVGVGASPYIDTGKIRLYLNSGTDASPVFTTFTWIQAGGVDISMPFF